MIKKVIFIINLLLFSLSLSGYIVLLGMLASGSSAETVSEHTAIDILEIGINLLVVIGLYGFAFNRKIMNKFVWMIVIVVFTIKTVFVDFDYSLAIESRSYIELYVVLAWQFVVLTALVMYLRSYYSK